MDRVPLEGKGLADFLDKECTKHAIGDTHKAFTKKRKRYVLGVAAFGEGYAAHICRNIDDINLLDYTNKPVIGWYSIVVSKYEESMLDRGLMPYWTI